METKLAQDSKSVNMTHDINRLQKKTIPMIISTHREKPFGKIQ